MATKKQVKLKTLILKTLYITASVFLLILILDFFGFFSSLEFLTIDARYTKRLLKKTKISDKIVTIIIDDDAIEKVGRWPWSWEKLKMIVETADYYSAKFCAFIDLNFNKESEVYFSEEGSANSKSIITNYIMQDSNDTQTILGAIENKNKEMISAINKYKNIFLCSNFYIPEIKLNTKQFSALTEIKKKDIMIDRLDNISSMKKYIIPNTENKTKLTTAIDFIPPLKNLNEIVKGVGYNRIFPDADGRVRHYSMAANYDGNVYPSLVTSLAAGYYKCPLDKIRIIPGKYIELQEGDTSISKFPLQIPINEKGMMTINWAGTYKETFKHLPYNLIAYHYSFIKGKQYLSNYKDAWNMPGFSPDIVYTNLNSELIKAGLVTPSSAESISLSLFIAWLMDYFNSNGADYMTFISQMAAMGLEDTTTIKNMWIQIDFNNKLFARLNETRKIPDFSEFIKELGLKEYEKELFIREGYRQTIFFFLKGMIDTVRPLYFPEPSNLKIGLKNEYISLLELSDKFIFTGLTATGLASFNPTPFENRYMMLGLTPNAFNTIITNQFLKFINPFFSYLLLIIIMIFISFLTLKSSLTGTIVSIILFVLYPFTAWICFEYGLIIPIIFVEASILLCYFGALTYKYIELQRERKKVRDMFSTMVSPEVLKIIEENPDKFNISGDLREATMFSSDVSGFTTISEGVTAQELANILNIYLTPMSNIIMKYNGYIDKYEGDAIKADFGVLPLQTSSNWELDKEHHWKCCYAALEQQEELSVIQRMIQIKFGVKISARIGVNTGVVSAGNMGSEKKRQFSVMGAAVTLAEELEPVNKLFESWIAIGPETYKKAEKYIETRLLNYLEFHEGEPLLPVYELLGWNIDKFMEYWKDKPAPSLILEGIRKMPPEKILGYYHYYSNKKLDDTDFIIQIKKFFTDLS
ncbi:adenylate/guanylate cyclase domain-containing protein, partial [Candidatus Dependentiae bacterium]|nr:adenylate/guanylate cyclase domain-containing protein [Candidatus Dependentiae bacterium]